MAFDRKVIVHYGKFKPECGMNSHHLQLAATWGQVTCPRCLDLSKKEGEE